MARSRAQIVEEVRRMVAGEDVTFADLFATDGVLEYPFAAPGQPGRLQGRETIRAYFDRAGESPRPFRVEGVDVAVYEGADPEVVTAEIEHHGRSSITGEEYRFLAVGIIRVRNGEIVSYRDYMDPAALGRLLGRGTDPGLPMDRPAGPAAG
jgi:ketosteroid isomerase-like protein